MSLVFIFDILWVGTLFTINHFIDGLVQDCNISIANTGDIAVLH